MENKYLEKLEFNKIKENLSTYSSTFLGKEKCLNLMPLKNKNDIEKALKQTTEATILIQRKGNLFIPEISNIIPFIKVLQSYSSLSISGLLEITNILKISRNLKEYFSSEEIDMSTFTYLENTFKNLYINPSIEEKIFSSILDENTIADTASLELSNIRKKITAKENEIKNKLNNLLHTKFVQDPIITKRNGRFVIPVKAEYQSEIKGFIHDTSSSGSTVFIEPLSVFEINNSINSLKNEESIEIEKILQKLSSLFFEILLELENDFNLIGLIDFIFAKAKYSLSLNATEPTINNKKQVSFISCYHPLILEEKAVKNSIYLGENYNTLIITGPNTGGKTVTLKTFGLLCLMAMSGLHITAKENSAFYIFDNIFADIGDEQGILASLSTFSSHITNISNILNLATENSLVLLDELGSGTDPIEGENLAISILEFLHSKNILTIATTHYPKLKHFTLVTEGFENASVEFDVNTLSPTYKLLLGVPGTSNAFAISKKLGIPNSIIDRASNLIDNDDIKIEDLLKNIYEDKKYIEEEKEKIQSNSSKINNLKQQLEDEYNSLKLNKKEILDKAKYDAKQLLLDTKEEINEIIKEIETSKDSKKANNLRNTINKKIKDISLDTTNTIEEIKSTLPLEHIKINNEVFVNSLKQNGIILSDVSKDNKVKVQIGVIKTFFDITDLSMPDTKIKKEIPKNKNNREFNIKQISPEINVIGQNIEEACFTIDKYLDNCVLNGLMTVRIVHGKGTGTLRKGVHDFLKKHPHVKDFRIGTFGEGEMGATVVNLK